MENATVSISFDNVLADHLAADRLYYESTAFATLDKVVAVLLVFLGLFGALYALWWTLIFIPLAVLEWFNLLSVRPLVIRHGFKTNPKFRGTYHLLLDEAGIHFRTQSIDSRVTWNLYTKAIENDRLWLLVYGERMYSVIPKRAFKNDDEAARFKALIAKHVVGSKGQGA